MFGRYFRVTTFGESHGPALGVVVEGIPAGLELDASMIQKDMDRRKPGTSRFVSPRKEADQVEILSGVAAGKTLGSPVALLVRNTDARSKDYGSISEMFRPGHADFTYHAKYGLNPQPGGGRASGRETAARVAAGAIARALLAPHGVTLRAYTIAIGDIEVSRIDTDFAETHPLRCPDPDVADAMVEAVDKARSEHDSIGGIVELAADGVSAGLGDPVFYKLDAVLAWGLMSIGAVKGVEFGSGFRMSRMRGSQSNDPISSAGFLSNHAGGILGGISTGQTIIARMAVKPTASIDRPQQTVDINGQDARIQVKGRHDPCLCPRIGPVAEAMAALVLADAMLEQRAASGR